MVNLFDSARNTRLESVTKSLSQVETSVAPQLATMYNPEHWPKKGVQQSLPFSTKPKLETPAAAGLVHKAAVAAPQPGTPVATAQAKAEAAARAQPRPKKHFSKLKQQHLSSKQLCHPQTKQPCFNNR